MSGDEYTDLVEFLGRKFEQIDRRFEQIDRRFEQIDRRFEQIDRRFERVEEDVRWGRVLVEENTSQIRKLAEAFVAQSERLDRFQAEVRDEFASVRREMHVGFDAVHARVDRLEDGLTQVLAGRGR